MKWFLLLLVIARALTALAQSPSPDIAGKWTFERHSDFPLGDRLWLVSTAAGWNAVFYQSAWSAPPTLVSSADVLGDALRINIDADRIALTGQLSPDGKTLDISWSRNGAIPRTLTLHHVARAEPLTSAGLESTVASLKSKSDGKIADALYRLRLSERFDPAARARWETMLPGTKSRQALVELTDHSLFLPPSASALPALEKPSLAAQKQMLALANAYLLRTIRKLPDFMALRTTTAFQRDILANSSLHQAAHFKATVIYRDGQEKQHFDSFHANHGLTTRGEFGPVLDAVLLQINQRGLIWSRWEQRPEGPAAVFRYAVDAHNSTYAVDGRLTGYVAEVMIDPATGAILRVAFHADLEPANPLLAADILVDYGPVDIGGHTYICPLHGIAISESIPLWSLNDITFTGYRVFGSSIRILSGMPPVP
ncbi:MAG: hypothetical protein WCB58_13795 [Acidobacteriaceae bacterium]